MSNPHQKELVKLLRAQNYRHNMHTVFSDFVEMAAIALANPLDLAQAAKREARYMQIIGKYEADEQKRFPQAFGELVEALECGPADVLGAVFGELEQGNARAGQFFTPFEVCRLMARITVGDGVEMRERIAERGFVTASEPACGAGGQVIALAEAMTDAGINYQQHLHVTAVDVDARAAHMTFLQLSLLHVPAAVVIGNTLTLEVREQWLTPAHVLGMWDAKLRRGYALGSTMDAAPPVALVEPPKPIQVGQLALFDEVAA